MLRRLDKIAVTAALGQSLLFVLLLAWLNLSPTVASATESPKRILIFSSDDTYLPAITTLTQAFRSTLKNGLQSRVQFFNEAQDGFRISNDKYEGEFVKLLQRKYEGEHIDLILVLAPPALKFLLKHQGELFSDTPVVFVVNDQSRVADVVERAVINTEGEVLRIVDHFEAIQAEELELSKKTLEEIEREYITGILSDTGWRIEGPNGAARVLGLNPSTLRTRMAKLGIQKSNHILVSASEK